MVNHPTMVEARMWRAGLGLALVLAACSDSRREEAAKSLIMPSVIAGLLLIATIIVMALRLKVASIVLGGVSLLIGSMTLLSSGCAIIWAPHRMESLIAGAFIASFMCFGVGIVGLIRGISMKPKAPPEGEDQFPPIS